MRLSDKRISKRTRVMLSLLRLQRKYNRPIGFTELKKFAKMKHSVISASHDKLFDLGFIDEIWHQADGSSKCYDEGTWYKGILLNSYGLYWLNKIEKDIKNRK